MSQKLTVDKRILLKARAFQMVANGIRTKYAKLLKDNFMEIRHDVSGSARNPVHELVLVRLSHTITSGDKHIPYAVKSQLMSVIINADILSSSDNDYRKEIDFVFANKTVFNRAKRILGNYKAQQKRIHDRKVAAFNKQREAASAQIMPIISFMNNEFPFRLEFGLQDVTADKFVEAILKEALAAK